MSPAAWSAASHDVGVFCYGVAVSAIAYGALIGGPDSVQCASAISFGAFAVGALAQFLGPRLPGDHYSSGRR